MKYYKQWTLTETLMSVIGNIRKVLGDKYHLRADYNQIFLWTKEEEPVLKVVLFIEPTMSPSQAAFDELIPDGKVRRFRVAGSFLDIADRLKETGIC